VLILIISLINCEARIQKKELTRMQLTYI